MTRGNIGLDNPIFAGRMHRRAEATYTRRSVAVIARPCVNDVSRPKIAKKQVVSTKVFIKLPVLPKQSKSNVLRRDLVQPKILAKPSNKGLRRRRGDKRLLQSRMLSALAVLLFICGLIIGANGLRANHKIEAQVKTMVQTQAQTEGSDTQNNGIPVESRPEGTIASYKVAPDLPRVVRIAKIGVEARVKRVSAKADNELGTPTNIFDAGWYDGSAKLGESGAVLLDGHVSGPTQNGVFFGLKTLKPGDGISVERGDGKIFNYKVVTQKIYDSNNVDMAAAMSSVQPGKNGLNLVTCTGKVDKTTNHFNQRLVVFAVQD
jgi:LPXTG-site transpeptidase (sortase) family protein